MDTFKKDPLFGFFVWGNDKYRGIINSMNTNEGENMSKIIFNAFQIKQLEANPNVSKVSDVK